MNCNKRKKDWEDKSAEEKLERYIINAFIDLKYITIMNTSYLKQIQNENKLFSRSTVDRR